MSGSPIKPLYLPAEDATLLVYSEPDTGVRMVRKIGHFALVQTVSVFHAWGLAIPVMAWGGSDCWYADELITYAP